MVSPAEGPAGTIRVLHLISSLAVGGAETMLCNVVLASEGAALRHMVVAMVPGGGLEDRLRAGGIPVETLGMRRGRPSPSGVWRFVRLLRRTRPHIVQTWMYHADLLGLLARPIAGARVAWNIRSGRDSGIRSWIGRRGAALSRWPDAVVVNSEAGRRLHTEYGYRPRHWRRIGNGFDLDVFRPSPADRAAVRRELGLAADTPLVGLIARWDPLKGHRTFLAAAARLAVRMPDVRFLLAGDGISVGNRALADLIAPDLARRLVLLGRRADIPRLTAALDVASCTSDDEAFPNVVGEAMACAVPCVVTDVGDAAAIVSDPDLVVPPGQPDALADRWARLLAMTPAGRRAIGERGRARVERHYSLPAIADQYRALYTELAGRS